MNEYGIEIRSLSGIPFEDIAASFLNAFADYGLKMDTESLSAMLKRRGANMDLSFAAFSDGRIVSFVLNGIGEHNGQPTAYDTGTGTVKEFRGLGLTDRIFNYSIDYLVNAGIRNYLLEVLTANTPAIRIYARHGLEKLREFECFAGENQVVSDALRNRSNTDIELREVPVTEIEKYASFMDFNPSWQNSFSSVKRNPEVFLCLMAYDRGIPVGWGISETDYGDITQIAVSHDYRRQGIGSRLMLALVEANRLDRTKVLNVESGCESINSFLRSSGFDLSCRQYEMSRKL